MTESVGRGRCLVLRNCKDYGPLVRVPYRVTCNHHRRRRDWIQDRRGPSWTYRSHPFLQSELRRLSFLRRQRGPVVILDPKATSEEWSLMVIRIPSKAACDQAPRRPQD